MLVQSGGGKVYAVLADNADFELAILPAMQIISTSVVLHLRCRYKIRTGDHFDPMLVPKRVLAGGVVRSGNTLRSAVVFNTGFTVEKAGKSFPALMATKVQKHALLHYLTYDAGETPGLNTFLGPDCSRDDFQEDFAKLVEQAIGPIYPAKDFGPVPALLTVHDFGWHMENVEDAHTKLASVPDAFAVPDAETETNVKSVQFGMKVDNPE